MSTLYGSRVITEANILDKIKNKQDLTNIELINKIVRDIRFGKEPKYTESNSKKLLKKVLSLFPGIGLLNLGKILTITVDLFLDVIPDDKASEIEDIIYDMDLKIKAIEEKMANEANENVKRICKENKENLKKEQARLKRRLKEIDKQTKNAINSVKESNQSSNNSVLYPIFIINSFTNTTMGNMIRTFTKEAYTHSAISFSSKLDKMYSYAGAAVSMNGKGGLTCESLEDYIDTWRDCQIQVSVVFFKEKEYRTLKERMDYYLANYKITSYSFESIFNVILNRAKDSKDALSMICSQFVDNLLKFVHADLTGKSSNLVTPGNMSNIKNPKVYLLFEGRAMNYDADKAGKLIRKLSRNLNNAIVEQTVINEAMEFPIQFDEEGNLLIARRDKVDFLDEYNKSKKLREGYIKYKNLEGLKYESAKLWYLNTIILKKLDSEKMSDEERDELIKVRSKILTEFSLYTTAIMKMDKKFNFGSYYESTPFNDAKIKINGSTIKYSARLLSELVKSIIR